MNSRPMLLSASARSGPLTCRPYSASSIFITASRSTCSARSVRPTPPIILRPASKAAIAETRISDDHRLSELTWPVQRPADGTIVCEDVPALLAINERLRDDYIADAQRGLDRWNKVIERQGIESPLCLPHRGFHRQIGAFFRCPYLSTGRYGDSRRVAAPAGRVVTD